MTQLVLSTFLFCFAFFFGEGVHEGYHSNTTAYEKHPPPPFQLRLEHYSK